MSGSNAVGILVDVVQAISEPAGFALLSEVVEFGDGIAESNPETVGGSSERCCKVRVVHPGH